MSKKTLTTSPERPYGFAPSLGSGNRVVRAAKPIHDAMTAAGLIQRRKANREARRWAIHSDEWECPKCATMNDPLGVCSCGYSR